MFSLSKRLDIFSLPEKISQILYGMLCLALLAAATYVAYYQIWLAQTSVTNLATTIISPHPKAVAAPIVGTRPLSPATPPATVAPATPSVALRSSCTDSGFIAPYAATPTSSVSGVVISNEPTSYYTVSSVSTEKLHQNILNCAARQPYIESGMAGLTMYHLSPTSYRITPVDDITCRVSDIRVALHFRMLLPALDRTRSTATVNNQWESIVGPLYSHENEHRSITTGVVQRYYRELSGLQTDCATINSQVADLALSMPAKLQAANQAFDAQTDHGTR